MPLVNKQKDESLGAIRVSNEIHSRGEAALAKILGQSEGIKRPIPARLGSVVTGELFVPDTNNARVYISGQGDEPNTLGTIPSVNIPKEFLKFGQPIEVRKQPNGSFKYAGVDTSTGEIFNEGNTDEPDQSPVTQSQLDFASLQPYNGLTATVKGAIYGDYAVRDLVTADFSASPLDTSSVAINIPTTANRAIGVLVQLDPSTSTLSYKQSSEFNGGLSLSAAYALDLLPLRDAGKWRVGYLKLSTGITQFDYASVWTCAEFFPNAVRGSVGANDNRLARTDGTSGTGIQGSTVTLDDEGDLSSLTSLSYVDASELTISSGAVTVLQSYHKIDTEANTASDDLDTISGGRAGMSLFLRAEDGARTVVIRHNGGGTGNIRTSNASSISLDESYKVVELLYDGTNWNVISGGGSGGTILGGTGATDNSIIRADGTGGSTIQAGSGVTLSDSGAFSGATYSMLLNKFQYGGGTVTLIDASGVQSTAIGNARHLILAANTGTSDDFLGFSGNFLEGELLLLRADAGDTITLKHNNGSASNPLYLVGGTDIVLSETNPVHLVQLGTGGLAQIYYQASSTGANTTLSNLGTVALNTSIISDTDNTDDLGSSAVKFRAVYANADYLEERSAPSTPSSGDLVVYANTDGKAVSLNDGGVARILGVMTEIVPATELGANQTTITLSSIPAHFQDLRLVLFARSTSTAAVLNITFNADTGSSYSSNRTSYNNAGTATTSTGNNQTQIAANVSITSSSGTSGYYGSLEVTIHGYAESAKSRVGTFTGRRFETATDFARVHGDFSWENVSNAISSIELNLSVGQFASGTIYALYGIGTAA